MGRIAVRVGVAAPLALVAGMLVVPFLAVAGGVQGANEAATGPAVPERVLAAYQAGAERCPGLRWELLAGIGWVESRHGTSGGAQVDPDTGAVSPYILGPRLDGRHGRETHPVGTWLGRWGLRGPWEQALGPMQFRPPTFEGWGIDVDGDGVPDPHDIDDATATAATYLCGPNGAMRDEHAALVRYNADAAYATEVLEYADSLGTRIVVGTDGWLCPVAGPVSFTDTWGAPRSGGRRHQGVDMFAPAGTPVVAPVAGAVEFGSGGLGGLSFRLWGDDGNFYYGAHLSRLGPLSGLVGAGTVLGYVGTSGNAAKTPPHLHFEIQPGRRRGDLAAPVNPTPTVTAACGSGRLGVDLSPITAE